MNNISFLINSQPNRMYEYKEFDIYDFCCSRYKLDESKRIDVQFVKNL
jgi:hypothetical protein